MNPSSAPQGLPALDAARAESPSPTRVPTLRSAGSHGFAPVGAERPALPRMLKPARPLHRLAMVRRLQGVSRRTVSRRLKIDVSRVKQQERPTSDLLISDLYAWQEVLDVPVSELLIEADDKLAAPVMRKAHLLRMMKTVLAMVEAAGDEAIRRMAQTLLSQILEIAPELQGVAAWHAVGQRRGRNELGVAAVRRLSEDVFVDLVD